MGRDGHGAPAGSGVSGNSGTSYSSRTVMKIRCTLLAPIAVALGVLGCSRPASSEAVGAVSASADSPSATVSPSSAPAAASSVPAPSAAPLAGEWSGGYDATRATIVLPKKNPWPAWKEDSGKQLGKGMLDLQIDPAGVVRGRASGALGALVIRGQVEEGRVRATVSPENVEATGAMAGTLTGEAQGADLRVLLRLSDEKGETVRTAESKLTRK